MAFERFEIDRPRGVNFSQEPSQLDVVLWDNASEVAFRHGNTKKVSGYEQGFGGTGEFGTNTVVPECIVPLRDDAQNYYWWSYASRAVEGGNDVGTIYRITAKDQHTDVTPRDGGGVSYINIQDYYRWSGDAINGVPYMTYVKPYLYDDLTSKYIRMPLFPGHVETKSVRTYRNYMIAMNFKTSDFYEPDMSDLEIREWAKTIPYLAGETEVDYTTRVRDYAKTFGPWATGEHQTGLWWSHETIGKDVEGVVWSDADPTKSSGWNFLGGMGGPIIDGKVMRDSFMIYRERAVWQMTYIGGINVFAFKEVFTDVGVLGQDCVAELDGWHFVVGQSDVYMHNGVQKKSVADGVVRKELFRSIDPAYTSKVFVAVRYEDKEAWVCVPEAGTNDGGQCNIAFVYNWEENTWSKRSLPNSQCATYTILSIPEGDVSWIAAGEDASWDEASDTWMDSFFKYNASKWGLVFGGASTGRGYLYTSIEDPTFDGENIKAFVEKKWMDMGDNGQFKTINKIYPLVRGGVVDVYVAGSNGTGQAPVWKYCGRFDPYDDMYLGCRATGRFLHVRFEIPETSRAEIKGYAVEFTKGGTR